MKLKVSDSKIILKKPTEHSRTYQSVEVKKHFSLETGHVLPAVKTVVTVSGKMGCADR